MLWYGTQDSPKHFVTQVSPWFRNMRDYLLFYLNGCRQAITGDTAFLPLAEFLRLERRLTGTKIVCAEGDCGACTVLLGRPDGERLRYEVANSCILFLYQLDGLHVVTVEGLQHAGKIHPVQEAMVVCHGSQCGYCTPGFVCSLTGLFEEHARPELDDLRLGLTGNLCRCTGYVQILEAGQAVNAATLPRLNEIYTPRDMLDELRQTVPVSVHLETRNRSFFAPRRLEDALAFRARHADAVIVSGNTELGVLRNKKGYEPDRLLSLKRIPGLAEIAVHAGTATLGANVTWTQLEAFSHKALPEFYRIIIRFGSPQIRNVATLAANVANGSPIADSLPLLFVAEAEVELTSLRGTRRVRLDRFYNGYKLKDLAADEIITRIHLPLPPADDLLRLYKVSRRNDLDIATFGAAIRIRRDGGRIARAWIAYSGVAATVVRLPRTEEFLSGMPFTEATFAAAGCVAAEEIKPISDVRGSRDYRTQLAENVLVKFWWDCQPGRAEIGLNGRKSREAGGTQ